MSLIRPTSGMGVTVACLQSIESPLILRHKRSSIAHGKPRVFVRVSSVKMPPDINGGFERHHFQVDSALPQLEDRRQSLKVASVDDLNPLDSAQMLADKERHASSPFGWLRDI